MGKQGGGVTTGKKKRAQRACSRCGGKSETPGGRIRHTKPGCRVPSRGTEIPESERATARPNIRVARTAEATIRKLAEELGISLRDSLEGSMEIGAALIRRAGSVRAAKSIVEPSLDPTLSDAENRILDMLMAHTAGPPLIMSDADAAYNMGLEAAVKFMARRFELVRIMIGGDA